MTSNPARSPSVVHDLGIFIGTGRAGDPRVSVREAQDAEALGLCRIWSSERYDLKEAGALMSAMLAATERIRIGTGVLAAGSRHPLLTAALGSTLQALHGDRFHLGIGRSIAVFLAEQGLAEVSFEAFGDYIDIVKALWAGETVAYDGPVGRFSALKLADLHDGSPPDVWAASLGGPRACRVAARHADGVVLQPCMTPEATAKAVGYIREERERLGLDPAIPICQPLLSAPELDPERTKEIIKARMVGYLQIPVFRASYARANGWDAKRMEQIAAHPMFSAMTRATADQSFRNEDLLAPAEMVPDSWVSGSCAVGPIDACVELLQAFKDAGATELALYASTPSENAALIAAWRAHRDRRQVAGGVR